MMNLFARIVYAISIAESDIFLTRDFKSMGSSTQVNRVLRRLLENGSLVRIGLGIYARAKISVLTKKPIPVRPISVLAPEVFKRLGVEVCASRATQEYNAGKTTQVPVHFVVNTGNRRIRRVIRFGKQQVRYESALP
jgi:hypothetical protein